MLKGPYCDTLHLISHGLRRAQISKSSGRRASIDDLRSISASEEIEIEIPSKIGALLIIFWRESLAGRDRLSTDQEFMKGEYAAVLKRYQYVKLKHECSKDWYSSRVVKSSRC